MFFRFSLAWLTGAAGSCPGLFQGHVIELASVISTVPSRSSAQLLGLGIPESGRLLRDAETKG
jgi:hypothetical protein